MRCHRLSPMECFKTFVDAIFYVGKGTRARPYSHLAEAVTQHRMGTRKVGWGGCGVDRMGKEEALWARGCPAGLSQGAAHPGDLGEWDGCHLPALLPEQRAG